MRCEGRGRGRGGGGGSNCGRAVAQEGGGGGLVGCGGEGGAGSAAGGRDTARAGPCRCPGASLRKDELEPEVVSVARTVDLCFPHVVETIRVPYCNVAIPQIERKTPQVLNMWDSECSFRNRGGG